MKSSNRIEFSVITPTSGKRPKALDQAIASVAAAWERVQESLDGAGVEMLIGYDGLKGVRPANPPAFVKCYDLPLDNDWGNGIRPILLKACKGRRVVFLDDDNQLTPQAFEIYMRHPDAELVIGRIDTARSFEDKPWLPMDEPGKSLVRQGNIDPLCVCATRELVVDRCSNWQFSGYPADYQNIIRFHRRANLEVVTEEVVGLYDAGRDLDDHKTGRRSLPHEAQKKF